MPGRRPNFLLIMSDQQRADSVGYAHGNVSDTPFLDRMAGRGVVFDNAYSASTVCVPARSSLLTGLFDQRLPRGPDGRALKNGYWTLAHALAAAGYDTGLFGKMHFSPLGAGHGFQVMRTCEHLTKAAGYSPGDVDDYRRWLAGRKLVDPRSDGMALFPYDAELHPTHWITDQAIDFLKERQASRPFFAVVSYTSPHTPIDPPERYARLFDPEAQSLPADGFEVNDDLPPVFQKALSPPTGDFFKPFRVAGEPPAASKLRLSWIRALIRQIDDAVSRLMQHVSLEDTVVFFTSDHGDYGGHRGLFGKVPWIPFDDLAKVPFFCAGAGVAGGRRVTAPVQSCDVALTCLELAGLEPPAPAEEFDTASLSSVLAGGRPDDDRPVFCAFSMGWPMIRKRHMKLIWHWSGEQVLYDLGSDPGETRNVAHAHKALARDLEIRVYLQTQRPELDLWVHREAADGTASATER